MDISADMYVDWDEMTNVSIYSNLSWLTLGEWIYINIALPQVCEVWKIHTKDHTNVTEE